MKLTFLGTGASEGFPALWCECPVCAEAKKRGGKEIRRRCGYLLDSDTLIDFGPDSYWQSIEFGIDLTAIDRIVFTHPHTDHLNPVNLCCRRSPAYSLVKKQLNVIGGCWIFATIMEDAAKSDAVTSIGELNIRPLEAKPGEKVTDGTLELLPLRANHAPGRDALIYVLRRGGKSLLIANDTGYLPEDSWKLLEGVRIDAVVLDATCGLRFADAREGHMGADTCIAFRKRLIDMGCLTSEAPAFATHFSHNFCPLHEELVAYFAPHGISVAYDGLTLEV